MTDCRRNLAVVLCFSTIAACKGKTEAPVAAPATAAAAQAAPAKPAEPAAPANPVAAELAPLWGDIAKCEDLSDLYAKDKCPANFKLLETVRTAYEAVEKDPKRFSQIYDAVVDQVIHGTDLKARNCAAYAAWSKGYRGGKLYENNDKLAQELLDTLKKLGKEDGNTGYGIANMLGGWWSKDGPVRKALTKTLGDKTALSISGRRELIRHSGWVAKDVPDVLSAIRAVATDDKEDMVIRGEAISALAGVVADKPEVVENLLFLASDSNKDVVLATLPALGRVKAGTEGAKKSQAKMLERLNNPEPNPYASSIGTPLGQFADLDGLKDFTTFYTANAAKPGVSGWYSNFLYAMALSARFKEDAAADTALRAAVDTLLKDKGLTASDKGYTMDTLGFLGGPKSVATCKKYASDADAGVAAAANKCVTKAQAPAAK